jgi:hypothetical protein
MLKRLIAAALLCALATLSHAQTYTTLHWGIDRTATPNEIAVLSSDGSQWFKLFKITSAGTPTPYFASTFCSANQWITASSGVPSCSQPAFSNLSGQAATAQIADNAVTNGKLAQMAQGFKGRATSGTGNAEDLTAAQAAALLYPHLSASHFTNAVTVCGADPTGVADSTTAINNCISTYDAVALPAGTYKTSACINVSSSQSLIGAGADATTIQVNSTTASGVCVPAYAQKYTLKDFEVTRVGTPTNTAHGVNVSNAANNGLISNVHSIGHYDGFVLGATANSLCSWCVAQENYNDGFGFVNDATSQTMQWSLVHTLSEKNDGWGYLFFATTGATNSIQGSPWIAPQSYGNTAGGFGFFADGTAVINDIALYNIVASSDGGSEIHLATNGGTNHQISGGLVELAGVLTTGRGLATAASDVGYGVGIYDDAGSIRISGLEIAHNSQDGINTVSGAVSSLSILGNTFKSNGQASATTYHGININGSNVTNLLISNNQSYNDSSATQGYGIVVNPAATNATISTNIAAGATGGCFFDGSPTHVGNVGSGC